MIDLRSDTATRPTAGMRAAIAAAEVGDEQRREDPTVNELERRAAALLGHEDALFLPTATMANEIALLVLAERGDELYAEADSHLMVAELGGPALHAGLLTRPIEGVHGRFDGEALRRTIRPRLGVHSPPARIVSVENTHNSSGGRVWPFEHLRELVATARELELVAHLDGARLLNASVASGVPAAEIGRLFDTVTLCLSKGLGCPLGALLAGSSERMREARRLKHLFGGAMRQAGIVAAAGLYALEHHVERLADDHRRARHLADGLAAAGLPVDPTQVETNFVHLEVGPLGYTSADAIARLEQAGVGLSTTTTPGVLRALTHLDIDDEAIEFAIAVMPGALGVKVA